MTAVGKWFLGVVALWTVAGVLFMFTLCRTSLGGYDCSRTPIRRSPLLVKEAAFSGSGRSVGVHRDGLDTMRDRVIEYLAVRKLKNNHTVNRSGGTVSDQRKKSGQSGKRPTSAAIRSGGIFHRSVDRSRDTVPHQRKESSQSGKSPTSAAKRPVEIFHRSVNRSRDTVPHQRKESSQPGKSPTSAAKRPVEIFHRSVNRSRDTVPHQPRKSSQSGKSLTGIASRHVSTSAARHRVTINRSSNTVGKSNNTINKSSNTVTSQDKTTRPSTLTYREWIKHIPCLTGMSSRTSGKSIQCCLKYINMRIPVGLTLQDRSTLEKAKFSKWFIEALPPRDIPRFKTCAVVSSASSLREYRYGKEIDAHDAVFRINNAPVDGYEEMVGQRTTVRVINSQVPFYYNSSKQTVFNDMLEHPPKGLIIFERDELPAAIGKDPRASKATNASLLWDKSKWNPLTKYSKLKQKFPNLQYYLTHPVFAFFSQWRLLEYVTDHKLGMNEASSGFIAVILATFLCDSVTSYEVATDRVSEPGPYYYSSGQAANYRYWYSWHPLPAERELFKKIGKCRSGTTTCTISIADALC